MATFLLRMEMGKGVMMEARRSCYLRQQVVDGPDVTSIMAHGHRPNLPPWSVGHFQRSCPGVNYTR